MVQKRMMTHLLRDILGQPAAFRAALHYQRENRFAEFERAAALLHAADHLLIVAIGASFNAGLALAHSLNRHRRLATLIDASEFDLIRAIPAHAVVIFLTRSGRSIELVRAVERCAREGISTLAFTNDPDSPVARGVKHHISLRVPFDHAVSIATYTAIVLFAALFANHVADPAAMPQLLVELERAAAETERVLPEWQARLRAVGPDFLTRFTYFLARAESLASAHAGMLLWQEVIKIPAAALSTGTFRHGPQEVLRAPMNIFLWLSPEVNFNHDVQLARDLVRVGANVTVLSPQKVDLPGAAVWLTPPVPDDFAAAFNIVPVQLWAEHLAGQAGVDCDRFIHCSYVVEKDGGL